MWGDRSESWGVPTKDSVGETFLSGILTFGKQGMKNEGMEEKWELISR